MTQQVSCRKPSSKSTYYPKSLRRNMAKLQYSSKSYENDLKKIDYFAFGDSFVNMFLHAENTFYVKLKGKSIKGLAKTDKEERSKIEKWVKATPKNVTLIFNFGQVDLNLIRYYKLAHGESYPQETFKDYINWISSLNRKTIVIGIFVSPITRDCIVDTLQKYGTLEGVEVEDEVILKEHAKTEDTRKKWNDLMEAACKKTGIKFLNIFEHHKQIDEKFIDQNPKTIHLRYLPSIIELHRHLPDLKIDIQKSLEIEEEYVVEKTQRYSRNLQILEQNKRLQSLQSQQTRTQNNSSKDPLDEHDNLNHSNDYVDHKSETFERGDKVFEQEYIGSQQYLEDKEQNERFIDLLGIQGIESPQKLFERVREHDNGELLWKLADRIVEVGVFWMNAERYDCCTVNFYLTNSLTLIKDICQVQQETQSAETSFQKMIRSKLQEYFERNLHSNDKTRVIEDIITLIVFFHFDQKTFSLTILPEKLIFIVLKQLLTSVFRRIISGNPEENDGLAADVNCFYRLKQDFAARMNEIFLKQNAKKKINEKEFFSKFLELMLTKRLKEEQVEEKTKQLDMLLDEECPYGIYSPWVSEELVKIFDIELDFYEFGTTLKISQKYLRASQENSFNIMKQRVSKLRQQLKKSLDKINKELDEKNKHKEKDLCCKCGCLMNLINHKK